MSGERIVVAMSGGVDSAVAAALCVQAGYDVIGISLRLARDGAGSCCSLDDFHDAAAVARHLGFPHYVFDFRDAFDAAVVQPFIADYLAGRTPNPCARCNEHIKFDRLWQRARELGATKLATGHYARIGTAPDTGLPILLAAADPDKDQSYFLHTLDAAALARTLFPIGHLRKPEVRAVAAAAGLPVADKPESMDVCFLSGGNAGAFVDATLGPEAQRGGELVDEEGAVLGRHDGIHRFTIGQRRGLGLGGGPPRYVRAIDATTGRITLAAAAQTTARGLIATDVTWSAGTPPPCGTALSVRIRHRHPLIPAQLHGLDTGVARIRFDDAGPAVTPGQVAVFYSGESVLGGGWIAEELR